MISIQFMRCEQGFMMCRCVLTGCASKPRRVANSRLQRERDIATRTPHITGRVSATR